MTDTTAAESTDTGEVTAMGTQHIAFVVTLGNQRRKPGLDDGTSLEGIWHTIQFTATTL